MEMTESRMNTLKRGLKFLLWVSLALLPLDWVLGVLRFDWPPAKTLFAIVNFPCSPLFLWLEQQPSSWWREQVAAWVNDEVGQMMAFGGMIVMQAFLITMGVQLLRAVSARNGSAAASANRQGKPDGTV